DAGAKAFRRLLQSVKQHALAVFVVTVGLLQEGIVVQNFFIEGPGIFRKAKRGVRPEEFGKIDRVGHGMRDRQIRLAGIDVHRRDVHLHFWRDLLQIKAAYAVRAKSECSFELYRDPFRILADFQGEALPINRDPCLLAVSVGANLEVDTQLAARIAPQGIVRAWNVGATQSILAFDGNAHSAFAKLVAASLGAAETERPLTSLQVGDTHSRK